jgi:hypothetical protein
VSCYRVNCRFAGAAFFQQVLSLFSNLFTSPRGGNRIEAISNGVVIYARDMHKSAEFYRQSFGSVTTGEVTEGLIDLESTNGVGEIRIHQAAKGVKLGIVYPYAYLLKIQASGVMGGGIWNDERCPALVP